MKRLLLLSLFVAGCGPIKISPQPPAPKPAPTAHTEAFTVRAPSGGPADARATLDTDDGLAFTATALANGQYGFDLAAVIPLHGGWLYVTDPTGQYRPITCRVLTHGDTGQLRRPDDEGEGLCSFELTFEPNHVDPRTLTVDELLNWTGNFAGIYLPELKPQCPQDPVTLIKCVADNGNTPRGHVNGLMFTANYRLYPADKRKAMRESYKVRRFRQFPISIFCTGKWEYHGLFPPCAQRAQLSINDALHELYDDGLIPVPFILDDDEPNDLTTPIGVLQYEPTLDRSLIRIAVPFWEHYNVTCATLKVHREFPEALLFYHNPVNTDAPYEDACFPGPGVPYPGGGAVYSWLKDHLDGKFAGVALQTGESDVPSLVGRIADFVASFSNGPRTGRVGAGWPSGLVTELFEDTNTIYDNFWSGGNEETNRQRSDKVLIYTTVPLCEDRNTRAVVTMSDECGYIRGFAAGGTVR